MYGAFCAGWFLPAKRAFIKMQLGIIQKAGTLSAKASFDIMVAGAIYLHHRFNGIFSLGHHLFSLSKAEIVE